MRRLVAPAPGLASGHSSSMTCSRCSRCPGAPSRHLNSAAARRPLHASGGIVVVPRQRYYRYTVDYHLHFFPSAAPLEHLFEGQATEIDGDWFVLGG